MSTFGILISLVTLIGLSSVEIKAQSPPPASPISLGIAAGYERGFVSTRFPVFNGSPACGLFNGGEEFSIRFGPVVTISELVGRVVGLRASILFTSRIETFSADPVDPQRVRDPQLGTIVELEREYRHTTSLSRLQLELLGTGMFGNRLRWFIGPTLSYGIAAAFDQVDRITGPGTFLFGDGEVQHTMEDRYPLSARLFGVGAAVGSGYRLPLSARIYAQPELYVRWTAPGGVADFSRSTVGAELRLALLYSPPPPPLPPPLLSASLDIFCVDLNLVRSDTAYLILSEVREETLLFLPTDLLEQGSGGVAQYHLLSSEQARSFRSDSIPGRPEGVRYELPNIIGQRLRENPESRLRLFLPVGRDGRLDTLVTYLRDVWSIPEERIDLVPSVDTSAGDHTNLLWHLVPERLNAPLWTTRIVREHDYPTIRLAPRIIAEAGVRSWAITITQGEMILSRYTEEKETRDPGGIPWEAITSGANGRARPLVATLSVIDSLGEETTARDSLPVTLVRRATGSGYRRVVSIPVTTDGDEGSTLSSAMAQALVGLDRPARITLSLPVDDERTALQSDRALSLLYESLKDTGIPRHVVQMIDRHQGNDVLIVLEAD